MTSADRPLPTFLIIGAQKGGTTSLFAYLARHPAIVVPFVKEVHFFDHDYHRGESWYRSAYPRPPSRAGSLAGEATPYYLYHPCVPERVHALNPAMKLIVLLRDPVERAYSHYTHAIRRGRERRSFEDALQGEPERMAVEEDRLRMDSRYRSYTHQHHSYLSRGRYLEQLHRWREWFPPEQMLILRSEDMFAEPARVYAQALDFLGVADGGVARFAVHNAQPYRAGMSDAMRHRLVEYYTPPTAELQAWLGRSMNWSVPAS